MQTQVGQILESPKLQAKHVFESGSNQVNQFHVDKVVVQKETGEETKEKSLENALAKALKRDPRSSCGTI